MRNDPRFLPRSLPEDLLGQTTWRRDSMIRMTRAYCRAIYPPWYTLKPVPGGFCAVDWCSWILGPAPGGSGESWCLTCLRGIYS